MDGRAANGNDDGVYVPLASPPERSASVDTIYAAGADASNAIATIDSERRASGSGGGVARRRSSRRSSGGARQAPRGRAAGARLRP